MKINSVYFLLFLGLLATSSCKDQEEDGQEQQEVLERREAREKAELKAEKERMEWEAGSLGALSVENASLGTFSTAFQQAELTQTLTEEKGPFTIFAPTDEAFERLEGAAVDSLMDPQHSDHLKDLLHYHVVQDEITARDLRKRIRDGDGEYALSTLGGGRVLALISGEDIVLKDEKGNTALLLEGETKATNGMLHRIDAVLVRK